MGFLNVDFNFHEFEQVQGLALHPQMPPWVLAILHNAVQALKLGLGVRHRLSSMN